FPRRSAHVLDVPAFLPLAPFYLQFLSAFSLYLTLHLFHPQHLYSALLQLPPHSLAAAGDHQLALTCFHHLLEPFFRLILSQPHHHSSTLQHSQRYHRSVSPASHLQSHSASCLYSLLPQISPPPIPFSVQLPITQLFSVLYHGALVRISSSYSGHHLNVTLTLFRFPCFPLSLRSSPALFHPPLLFFSQQLYH